MQSPPTIAWTRAQQGIIVHAETVNTKLFFLLPTKSLGIYTRLLLIQMTRLDVAAFM